MGTRLSPPVAAALAVILGGGLVSACSQAERKPQGASTLSPSSPSSSGSLGSSDPSRSSPGGDSSDGAEKSSAPARNGTPTPTKSGSNPQAGGQGAPPSPTKTTDPGVPSEITVVGQVEYGVEPGCILLRGSDKAYVLIGGDQSLLSSGGRFVVKGQYAPNVLTTCQQGTPLRVTSVRRP